MLGRLALALAAIGVFGLAWMTRYDALADGLSGTAGSIGNALPRPVCGSACPRTIRRQHLPRGRLTRDAESYLATVRPMTSSKRIAANICAGPALRSLIAPTINRSSSYHRLTTPSAAASSRPGRVRKLPQAVRLLSKSHVLSQTSWRLHGRMPE